MNARVKAVFELLDERFTGVAGDEHLEQLFDDGRWTEGDPHPEVTMSSIPGGRYDLVVTLKASKWTGGSSSSYTPPPMPDPTATSSSLHGIFDDGSGNSSSAAPSWASTAGPSVPVTVTVKRGGIFGGNILLGLLLILVWPVIYLTYLGLLMEELDIELQDAWILAFLTSFAKFIVGMILAALLIYFGVKPPF